MSSPMALVKRQSDAMALMPPPPTKRIKRPSTVLDEDDYTNALSDIIARDYFPGLAETKAQEEYLTALESDNDVWIREAGQKLQEAMTPLPSGRTRRTSRDTRYDEARSWTDKTPVPDTPRGNSAAGSDTPIASTKPELQEELREKSRIDTSTLSLSSFQAKYTSEDNESFNTVLDKQNNTRRTKYAHLWTADQRIPSQRLLTHRAQQAKLLEEKANHEALAAKLNEAALVPISTGATSLRPASVDSWQHLHPNNTLMFRPDGIEESGYQTIMAAKEAASKAGPKETVFANTRFPPQYSTTSTDNTDTASIPPSPSLNTTIIARRDLRRAAKPTSSAPTAATPSEFGSDTPRVAGYAFVDEDEPENLPFDTDLADVEPTYRDLLAGQTGDSTPNPFKLSEIRRREDLHLRLVAKEQARKREKELETRPGSGGGNRNRKKKGGGGAGAGAGDPGNMTPAARKLMEKLGKTPIHAGIKEGRVSSVEMWTPGATPRRKR